MGKRRCDLVPIKAYVDERFRALKLLGLAAVVSFATVMVVVDGKNSKATSLALDGVDKVTKTILENVDEKARHHNGLFDIIMGRLSKVVTFGHILATLAGGAAAATIMGYFQ